MGSLSIQLHHQLLLLLRLEHPLLLVAVALIIGLQSELLLELLGASGLPIRTRQNIVLLLLLLVCLLLR